MINVFHIVNNKIWSGPEQYAFDMARCLKDSEFYVEVVCKKSEPVIQRFQHQDVPVSILPLKGFRDFDSPNRLTRLLKRGQNIIHVHSIHDAFTAVLAKTMSDNSDNIRIMLTHHGVKRPHINMMSKMVYRQLDRVIFVSQRSYDEFMPRYKKFDRDKAVIIRDSVLPHSEPSTTIDLRKEFNISSDKTLLMYQGRISREKGLDTLINALTYIDNKQFHLVIAGAGQRKYMKELKALITEHKLDDYVSFIGYKTNIQDYVKQCDFGVLPSVIPEGHGLSNLEFMMEGKAHIATNNGAQKEYLRHRENSILVSPDNPYELASYIKLLIEDPELRNRIGAQAQQDFNDHLNYDNFYQKISALYKSLF